MKVVKKESSKLVFTFYPCYLHETGFSSGQVHIVADAV